jgi:DNA-binding PadR family transcriptional regulator
VPLAQAVLALLGDGPAHGYALKVNFDAAVGPEWGALSIGHLYQVLDRLRRDGLVHSTVVPQQTRPDRTVYEITEQGRRELSAWLEAPTPRQSGHRDDQVLKIMAAARVDADAVRGVTRRQRSYLYGELRTVRDLRQAHAGDPLLRILLDSAAAHIEADLRLADRIEDDADDLAAAMRTGEHEKPAVPANLLPDAPTREPGLAG